MVRMAPDDTDPQDASWLRTLLHAEAADVLTKGEARCPAGTLGDFVVVVDVQGIDRINCAAVSPLDELGTLQAVACAGPEEG